MNRRSFFTKILGLLPCVAGAMALTSIASAKVPPLVAKRRPMTQKEWGEIQEYCQLPPVYISKGIPSVWDERDWHAVDHRNGVTLYRRKIVQLVGVRE
jgi:hypothetical protein